jgi:hypothetical protein
MAPWCAARAVKNALGRISRRALLQVECTEGRQHSDEQHDRTWHEVETLCALLCLKKMRLCCRRWLTRASDVMVSVVLCYLFRVIGVVCLGKLQNKTK